MTPCLPRSLGMARQPRSPRHSGSDTAERAVAYKSILYESLSDGTLEEIRIYLQQQRVLGSTDFKQMIQAKTERFGGIRPAHRPRKEK